MITREKSENNTLKLNVKLSNEVWEDAVQKAYEKTKGKFNIQGFRKGKAPKKVIEKNYGETVFFDEAFEEVVSKEYNEYLQKNTELEPVSYPRVKVNSIDEKGLDADLTVDLMPEVVIEKTEGIEIKKDKVEISDKDIQAEIDKLVAQNSRFEESEDLIENGDIAIIDFTGFVDGEEFAGGKGTDYRLEIGSHSFIDTFEEQLIGLKKGDTKDVCVTFPANYGVSELANKPAVFKVVIKGEEKKILPTVDDKFISNATEFENLNDYKANLREKLEDMARKNIERKSENDLIEAVVNSAKIELPLSMIKSEIERMIDDVRQKLAYQQITLEQYLEYTNTTLEDYKNTRKAEAEKALKTRLVMQKLIKDNKISVSDEELKAKLEDFAKQSGKTLEEISSAVSDYEKAYIEQDILMTKVIDMLKSKNKISE